MRQKVLLIDDSAILRRIACNVLGTGLEPCEVVTATRATEGFARACAGGVDLVLVDVQLAGPSAAEFPARLAAETRTAQVPVILLLGRDMIAPRVDTLPGNVVAILTKPFTPEALVSTVRNTLRGARSDPSLVSLRSRLKDAVPALPVAASVPPELTDQRAVAAAVETDLPPPVAVTARIRETPLAPSRAPVAGRHVRLGGREPLRPQSHSTTLRAALQTATEQRHTGVLRFSPEGGRMVEVYTDAGQIVVVATRDAGHYSIGAAEALSAKVSPATLDAAVQEQAHTSVPFLLTLGVRGHLSKSAAIDLLHRFGQRHFARLLARRQTAMPVEIKSMEALPGFALRLEPRREPLDMWLLGALRHVQVEDIAASLRQEGCRGIPSFRRGGLSGAEALELTDLERSFVCAVDGRHDLPMIARSLNLSGDQAFLLLYRFRCLEVMEYRSAPTAFVVTPRTNIRRVLPLPR